jgi:type III pantothenate kinase
VTNGYENPLQLGADRWAALIAARRRTVSEVESPPPAIVVNAGTAVTIDALDRDGVFRGGVILPGMRLMLQALAENTAALNVAPGVYQDFPVNTGDALYSGVIVAVAGAIEQMRKRLRHDGGEVACFVSGGAADEIAPYLTGPLEVVDNLVLEGALALADE